MSGIIDCEMHIGDEVFVHGYIDEIRNDTIIIRNDGGYFGTVPSEIDRKTENNSEKPNNSTRSKMEQVDEPQTGEMMTEEEFDSMLARVLTGNAEPQTEREGE